MKHPDEKSGALVERLQSLLAELGIHVGEDLSHTLVRHLQLVLSANERLNLTAIIEPDEALRLHVVDSIAALPEVLASPEGPYVDVGSGPGYPGIPLSLAAHRRATLVESVGKKANFLRSAIDTLDLGVEVRVYCGRAETLARKESGGFAVVTARAVAGLPALVELASPLLAVGGRFVALKGSPETEEVSRADRAAEVVGMHRDSTRTLVLPDGGEARTILTYRKVAAPAISVPRADGRAQRRPLG